MQAGDVAVGLVRAIGTSVSPTLPSPTAILRDTIFCLFYGNGSIHSRIQTTINHPLKVFDWERVMVLMKEREVIFSSLSSRFHNSKVATAHTSPSPRPAPRLRNGYTTIILSLRSCQRLINEQLGAIIDGMGSNKVQNQRILG